ncbi:AAA family ATPase [Nocardioides sp. CPCC 205120]|uniref:AAA family ATPase n=1 Tax=Nocardioides sp. CPCC 205120 TaxID=3406462 RepID=UPI003B503419
MRLVSRDRLLRRLDRTAPLTVLRAPPGFGKTTLAAHWLTRLRQQGAVVAWLRADAALDSPAALAQAVNAALARAGAGADARPGADPGSDAGSGRDDLGVAASQDRQVLVAVDDAHHLTDPAVADLLVDAVARSHDLHLVVCSDWQERFTAAAQRRGVDTQVITGAELSVPVDRVEVWAQAWGHELRPGWDVRLHELAGGWLLPLRQVLDATPSWSDEPDIHVAVDHLRHSVLPRIGDRAKLALAGRLAVPEQVDPGLAAALVGHGAAADPGRTDACSATVIPVLESHGVLWREHDPESGSRWRFPGILRRVLLEAHEQDAPEAARRDHQAVARALRGTGDRRRLPELLRHARRGEDWALLAQVWLEESWQLLELSAEEFSTTFAGLPERARSEHPALHLPASLADAVAETPATDPAHRARFIMRHYMQVGLDHLADPGQAGGTQDAVERMIAAMVALRGEGRLQEALAMVGRVEQELSRARQRNRWGVRSIQSAWFHVQCGLTHLLAGEVAEAVARLTKGYETSPTGLTGAQSAALLALVHALGGAHDDARRWLSRHEAVDVSGWWAQSLAVVPARLAGAVLALDALDEARTEEQLAACGWAAGASELWPAHLVVLTRQALLFGDPFATLARIEHVAGLHHAELSDPRGLGRPVVDRCRAALLLAVGEVNQARQVLRDKSDAAPWLRAPAARIELVAGDVEQAHRMACAAAWAPRTTLRERCEFLVLTAVTALALGRSEEAVSAFSQAHTLCRGTRNREPYLTPTPEQLQLLLELTGTVLDEETASAIAAMRRVYPEQVAVVELSPRETAVLRQMGRHETAAGVARALSVSVNTVRKQMVSVYAKLGVHDRASALLRAERLGLLED